LSANRRLLVALAAVILCAAPARGQDTPVCDGKWRAYPADVGSPGSLLAGAAVLNTHDAWVVGSARDDTGFRQPHIERWDGTAWHAVDAPTFPKGARLDDVEALSSDDAWAVGYRVRGHRGTVVLRWDGMSWTTVAAPSPLVSELHGVSAVSPDDVWAVGTEAMNGRIETLAEHWDGTTWSEVDIPDPGGHNNMLRSVSAVSPSFALAVGRREGAQWHTLIERWDGTRWTWVRNGETGMLGGVWALGTEQAWTAGPPARTWGGTEWTDADIPIDPPFSLNGVSGRSSTGVWAVGSRQVVFGETASRIIRWTGNRWRKAPNVPSPGSGLNELLGVAASGGHPPPHGAQARSALILGVC
jgi:hypothetical protein